MESQTKNESTDYTLHNTESAPAGSRSFLKEAEDELGFTPNLMAAMAESPATLRAYRQLSEAFDNTTLSPTERQIVLLATAVANGSSYAVPKHSLTAENAGMGRTDIEHIRSREPLSDTRQEALRSFVSDLVNARGRIDDARFQRFLEAGFSKQNALAVITGVTLVTLSVYVNHLVDAPLDEQIRDWSWTPSVATERVEASA